VFAAVAGAAVSVGLTLVHHRAYALETSSSIALTPEAEMAGVPISVWGLGVYLVFGLLAAWGLTRREHESWPWGVLFWLALSSVLYSAYLAYVAYGKYRLMCIWCTALYGINLVLLGLSVGALKALRTGVIKGVGGDLKALMSRLKVTAPLLIAGTAIGAGLFLFYPTPTLKPKKARMDLTGKIRTGSRGIQSGRSPARSDSRTDGRDGSPTRPRPVPEPRLVIPKVGKRSLVISHTPGKGAERPDVVVVELSDYECPFCAAAHRNVMKAYEKYKHRMKLYHRHFPLDNKCNPAMGEPFHRNACKAALAAICARRQDKFWPMHHLLFRYPRRHSKSGLRALARKAGLDLPRFKSCMSSGEARKELKEDIEMAIALKVEGTPTFVFFGPLVKKMVVSGLIDVEHFDKLFKAVDRAKARRKSVDPAKARRK
jgi:protein-disulfide isomerase/uncharacterized membrane protein